MNQGQTERVCGEKGCLSLMVGMRNQDLFVLDFFFCFFEFQHPYFV